MSTTTFNSTATSADGQARQHNGNVYNNTISIIQLEASLDYSDEDKITALHQAACHALEDVVQPLTHATSDVNARNLTLGTPWRAASTIKSANVVLVTDIARKHTEAVLPRDDHVDIKVVDGNEEVFFRLGRWTQLTKLMVAYCERQGLKRQ